MLFFFLLQVSDHFPCVKSRRQRNLGEFVFAPILLAEILQRRDLIGIKDVKKPEEG